MMSPKSGPAPVISPASDRRHRPPEHYDPTPIRKVGADQWRAVWRTMGLGELEESDTDVTEHVVHVLTSGGAPEFTGALLQTLHDLGNPRGAQALHDVSVELAIDRADWPVQVEDLAVELWLRATSDRRYARLLLVGEIAVHEQAADARFREYFGASAMKAAAVVEAVGKLEGDLREWLVREGMGSALNIKVKANGVDTVYCVFHGGRFQSEATVDDAGREAVLSFRPLSCDVIVHEPNSGRLRVTARSSRAAERYRTAFGRALHDDVEFFSARFLYTLAPIGQAIVNGSLPAPVPGSRVQAVNLVACQWVVGGAQVSVHGLRSRECIVEARRSGYDPAQVELTSAKLAFTFDEGGRPRRVDVVVRDNNRLECKRALYRDAVDLYLEAVGVRDRELAERVEAPKPNRWLGVQPTASWRQLLGPDLQTAIESGVLVRGERPLLAVERAGEKFGTAPAVAVEHVNESVLLVPANDSVAIVQADELAGYELNAAQLAQLLSRDLGCERSVVRVAVDGGYDLGPMQIGSARVRPFLLTMHASDPAAAERAFAALAGNEKWLSVHLPRVDTGRWTCALVLSTLAPPYRLRRAIVQLLRIESQVPALELASGERLVVDLVNDAAWLDGVSLDLAEAEWQTLRLLAMAAPTGRGVPASALGGAAGSAEQDASASVR